MGQTQSATDKLAAKSAGHSAPSCVLESRDNVQSPLTNGTFAHNIYKNDSSAPHHLTCSEIEPRWSTTVTIYNELLSICTAHLDNKNRTGTSGENLHQE
jgi:hypothetical protein